MTDKTAIEWADATWNPLVGCTKVSGGCDNCYAETFVNRFAIRMVVTGQSWRDEYPAVAG